MPVFRDQRMLRRNPSLKERWNMIQMLSATTMAIITARVMSAAIITAMKAAVIITMKIMSVVIITGKASIAVMKRVMRAAVVITASKTAVRSEK